MIPILVYRFQEQAFGSLNACNRSRLRHQPCIRRLQRLLGAEGRNDLRYSSRTNESNLRRLGGFRHGSQDLAFNASNSRFGNDNVPLQLRTFIQDLGFSSK
jgi:hypothetical protein